jgi:hypothetical protein
VDGNGPDDLSSDPDPVAAAVAELYGGEPETFTDRRKALAAAAKTAGDKGAAAAIAALRKPTRAAWVVNRLARAEPDAPARLAALAAALRAAEQDKDGPRLRELSAARGALIDALTAQALDGAAVPDPPSSLRDEVAATLTAALADPEVGAGFAAGTLTRAAHWSGFGPADLTSTSGASIDWAVPAADRSTTEPTRRAKPAKPPAREQRLAREAAERAAQQREQYRDLERKVVSAATATAETGAAEDRLESEVRDLEERLTQAREELAAARRRARHAEAAERRARQVLDRLPRP